MTSIITRSTLADTLLAALDNIMTDPMDDADSRYSIWKKWAKDEDMDAAYSEDMGLWMSGLAGEKPEGGPISVANLGEGYITRYLPRTFAIMLIFSREMLDDNKHDKAISAAKHLKRNIYRSMDMDITQMVMRAFTAAYTFADGVCMVSASHPLENGGTISNLMPTALAPSVGALEDIIVTAQQTRGFDGYPEPRTIEKIVHPVAQTLRWSAILNSTMRPEAGNFAEINVVKKDYPGIETVALPNWVSSSTQYLALTDAPGGPAVKFRYRPESQTWGDQDNHTKKFSISVRYARNCSNPARSVIGMNA
jgi:hypothetical protein